MQPTSCSLPLELLNWEPRVFWRPFDILQFWIPFFSLLALWYGQYLCLVWGERGGVCLLLSLLPAQINTSVSAHGEGTDFQLLWVSLLSDSAPQILTGLVRKCRFCVPKSFEIAKALVDHLPLDCLATSHILVTPKPTSQQWIKGEDGLQNTEAYFRDFSPLRFWSLGSQLTQTFFNLSDIL